VGFDVLTTCQPSTVWCSRERLPAAAAQPAKVRQSLWRHGCILFTSHRLILGVFVGMHVLTYVCIYCFRKLVFIETFFPALECAVKINAKNNLSEIETI
jgi:hypothetical protein